MANKVWNGGTNGDLGNAANWTGGLPGAADTGQIPTGLGTYPSTGTYPSPSLNLTVDAGGAIHGGTVPDTGTALINNGTLSGGTFAVNVENQSGGVISGGTYSGTVLNESSATISGGTFYQIVFRLSGDSITGGAFNAGIQLSETFGTATINGPIYNGSGLPGRVLGRGTGHASKPYLAQYTDLHNKYGSGNVNLAADMEDLSAGPTEDGDLTKLVGQRIALMLTLADDWVYGFLRSSRYSRLLPAIVDLDGNIPPILTDCATSYAMYKLAMPRGFRDYDKDGRPMTHLYADLKSSEETLKLIAEGKTYLLNTQGSQ